MIRSRFSALSVAIPLLSLLFSPHLWAGQSHLLYLGGGGEPSTPGTIFDKSVENVGRFVQSAPWNYEVRFNGGHPETEQILQSGFSAEPGRAGPFRDGDLERLVDRYERDMRSGVIRRGDQLMVLIDTHGAVRNPQEVTHSIAVGKSSSTDLDSLRGSTTVSLDKLTTLARTAREAGVKLAILDMSCHSGSTQALADDSTCVISSTSDIHYGYNTFSANFSRNLKPGKTLEQVFLETRQLEYTPSLPMISTAAGKQVADSYYEQFTPYLYYRSKLTSADKLTRYIQNENCPGCPAREGMFQKLLDQIREISHTLRLFSVQTAKDENPLAKLEEALSAYKKKQDEIFKTIEAWGVPLLKQKETFRATVPYGKNKQSFFEVAFDWGEILSLKPDDTIDYIRSIGPELKTEQEKAQNQAVILAWEKIRDRRNEILAKHPELMDFQKNFNELMEAQQNTYDLAAQVAIEERKLYGALYSQRTNENPHAKNPCKDFVL